MAMCCSLFSYLMDSTKQWLMDWLVLDWNVRGLNDKDKRLAVYNKIDESNCSVICLQETKCENFDHSFIRSFSPKGLINLLSLLLWEPLVALLFYGTVPFLMALFWKYTDQQ